MEPWLFNVGKVKVACGLQWVALNDEDGEDPIVSLKAEAKESGRRYAAYYPNEGGKYRIAAFASEDGARRFEGAVPAASWLADVVQRQTIYIEALDETATRWWIIVCKPGSMNVSTDTIMTDDAAIQLIDGVLYEAIDEGSNDGQITIIVGKGKMVPTSAMIDRADKTFKNIAQVLEGTNPPTHRIKQVVGIPRAVYFGFAGVLALGALAAGGYYLTNYTKALQTQAAREAEAAARAAEEARLAEIGRVRITQAVEKAIYEDSSIPGMPETVSHCYSVIKTVPRTLGGWNASSLTCDPLSESLTVSFSRNTAARGGMATQLSFEMAVNAADGTIQGLTPMAESANVTFTKAALPRRSPMTIEAMPVFNDISSEIVTAVQILQSTVPGITVQFAPPTPRSILYVDPTRDESAQPTLPVSGGHGFSKGTISLQGTDLWRLSAVVIDRPNITSGPITFSFSGATVQWTTTVTYITKA